MKKLSELFVCAVGIAALCAVLFAVMMSNGEAQKQAIVRGAMLKQARDACLNSGGAPVGSWYDEFAMRECIYPPVAPELRYDNHK